MKQNLQKELKEKVKPGVKPSDLRKLKRSKSADDIPSAPSSAPVSRSKSTEPFQDPKYPYTTLISQQELEKLKKETVAKSDTIALLRKKIAELEKNQPALSNTELDQALFKRHQNLKDWFTQYQKSKELDAELAENINEASTELISQDNLISSLRSQVSNLKLTNQSLAKDLDLAHRAVEWRKSPLPDSNSYPFLKYALYTLFIVLGFWMLNKN